MKTAAHRHMAPSGTNGSTIPRAGALFASRFPYPLRAFLICFTVIALIVVTALVAGFFHFRGTIANYNHMSVGPADGIVVLTGGADRIETGLDLLASGKANRLLISGVHSQTSKNSMFTALGRKSGDAPCCIDLGRKAENTVGNAREISEWAQLHHFSNLIVVTSEYHMPRTLVELENANPSIKFSPFAARSKVLSDKERDQRQFRTQIIEYGKFLTATARIWFLDTLPLTTLAKM